MVFLIVQMLQMKWRVVTGRPGASGLNGMCLCQTRYFSVYSLLIFSNILFKKTMVRYRQCVGTDKYGLEQEFTECRCPGENFLFDNTVSVADYIPWTEIDDNPEKYQPIIHDPNTVDTTVITTSLSKESAPFEASLIAAITVPISLTVLFVTLFIIFWFSKWVKKIRNDISQPFKMCYPVARLTAIDDQLDVHV